MVKEMLDNQNLTNRKFVNNRPGRSWLNGFMKRRKISLRRASNITRARASISITQASEYFYNLQAPFIKIFGSLENVKPSNVF